MDIALDLSQRTTEAICPCMAVQKKSAQPVALDKILQDLAFATQCCSSLARNLLLQQGNIKDSSPGQLAALQGQVQSPNISASLTSILKSAPRWERNHRLGWLWPQPLPLGKEVNQSQELAGQWLLCNQKPRGAAAQIPLPLCSQ